ncbi:helix-turn-helix transcriptional regulator [Microcoleus sp. FACHB-1515]|uniref:helix-turn-helix domain-containing protein n=1 Tax=Cyanophyceae TaxID=3028117 RepID=UPI0016873C5F|nr:helix-turn-helix transcriptional regulator [Microcoleus sp. FACHB-1515]MBD2091391.1 helix-turn-helix transcriptional regulator [Microcoleus sp. FACHB-1515]
MSKSGEVLKRVLAEYGISQSDLARAMGTRRSSIHNWVSGRTDPGSDTMLEIRDALEKINPVAAEEFMRSWLDKSDS